MSLLLRAQRDRAGNILERTPGTDDVGGVSRMRSVHQASTHVLYVRSVCSGRRNGSGERPKRRYKGMRNLWEVKHSLYYNKQARRSTLEKLLEFVKTRVPDATIVFLEKKIVILRNMYKKEHNKIQKSLRSGAAAAQVYVPRLWYFNKLQFLDDQTVARESLSTLPCSLPPTLPSTLPSTPAEAEEEQPGPSILEEVDAPSWSQVYYFNTYLFS
ncbi:hypothetical protein AB205_0049740 [Aquarana catesbeiana]|uniref:MADF domain-containing protein n=1 Tax=Aquarana catesbeiana TaxID=8400 RepID=A0A2G9RSV8_AQUCT|nr:hypothetical protein AB205_0049740 [Aquarana catesbeiana]